MRRLLLGAAVLAAYVAVAILTTGAPSRPLFELVGPPPPYRWVNPPPEFAPTNQKPEGAAHDLALGPAGSDSAAISTPDGQAAVVLKEGAFTPKKGEKFIVVRIDPLDPATVGPPPSGLRYDGNAYRFISAYKSSGVEAKLAQPGTILLTFPIVATHLLRRDGNTWTDLKANPVSVSTQIFAKSTSFGVFVAAGPPLASSKPKSNFPTALAISLGAAAVAVVAGLVARTRARKRRRSRAKSSAKNKPRMR